LTKCKWEISALYRPIRFGRSRPIRFSRSSMAQTVVLLKCTPGWNLSQPTNFS